MFVSKRFGAIAKQIRYEQVRFAAPQYWGILDGYFGRVANTQVLQELTKHVYIDLGYCAVMGSVPKFTEVLSSMTHLKHFCVTLLGFESIDSSDFDIECWESLMCFFDLKVETLTFIWTSEDTGSFYPMVGFQEEEVENAQVASEKEPKYQTARSRWMDWIYKESSWYNGPDEVEKVYQSMCLNSEKTS